MNSLFQRLKNKFTVLKQSGDDSYLIHNSEYLRSDKLETERKVHEEYSSEAQMNGPEIKLYDLLEKYPDVRSTAIDIGSGTGWHSAQLSSTFNKVISIEPSAGAIEISNELYKDDKYKNIKKENGFAEDILRALALEEPTLYFTGCVLSHLRDKEVKAICKLINEKAPVGSILSFAECWGDDHHDFMWHVRSKDWWQKQLSNWELDFFGPPIQDLSNRNKGFHGCKAR
jgi:SAM-dependent methyltransferase